MAILNFALIAQGAQTDPQTNLISLFNVLETIQHPGQFPAPMPDCTLVMLWERTDKPVDELETTHVRLSFESPLGTHTLDIVNDPIEVLIQPGTFKTKGLMPLGGMPIQTAGVNRIVISQEQNGAFVEVGEVRFNVVVNS